MRKSITNIAKVAIAAVTIGAMTTPAFAQGWRDQDRWSNQDRGRFDHRYDRYDRDDRDYGRGWDGELRGSGVARLHYMLKNTSSGRDFAMQYDYNRDGRLNMNEAGEANRALIRAADRNGDATVTEREARRVL